MSNKRVSVDVDGSQYRMVLRDCETIADALRQIELFVIQVTSNSTTKVTHLFISKGNNPKAIKLLSFQKVADTLDDDECLTVLYTSNAPVEQAQVMEEVDQEPATMNTVDDAAVATTGNTSITSFETPVITSDLIKVGLQTMERGRAGLPPVLLTFDQKTTTLLDLKRAVADSLQLSAFVPDISKKHDLGGSSKETSVRVQLRHQDSANAAVSTVDLLVAPCKVCNSLLFYQKFIFHEKGKMITM
jgi:hypothetical protein